jgi:hypothetical protein
MGFEQFTPTGAGALWPLCHKYGDFGCICGLWASALFVMVVREAR